MLTKLRKLWKLLDYVSFYNNDVIINMPGSVLLTSEGSIMRVASDLIMDKARFKLDQPTGCVQSYKRETIQEVVYLSVNDIITQHVERNLAIPENLLNSGLLNTETLNYALEHNDVQPLTKHKHEGCCDDHHHE